MDNAEWTQLAIDLLGNPHHPALLMGLLSMSMSIEQDAYRNLHILQSKLHSSFPYQFLNQHYGKSVPKLLIMDLKHDAGRECASPVSFQT